MPGMPKKAQRAVMTPAELKALIAAAGLGGESGTTLAKLVGFSRAQWWRLVNGTTPISERSARLIREKLKPKKS